MTSNSLLPSLIDAHSLLKLDLRIGNTNTSPDPDDPSDDKLQQASPEIAKCSPESNESESFVKIFSSEHFNREHVTFVTTEQSIRGGGDKEGGRGPWLMKTEWLLGKVKPRKKKNY